MVLTTHGDDEGFAQEVFVVDGLVLGSHRHLEAEGIGNVLATFHSHEDKLVLAEVRHKYFVGAILLLKWHIAIL